MYYFNTVMSNCNLNLKSNLPNEYIVDLENSPFIKLNEIIYPEIYNVFEKTIGYPTYEEKFKEFIKLHFQKIIDDGTFNNWTYIEYIK